MKKFLLLFVFLGFTQICSAATIDVYQGLAGPGFNYFDAQESLVGDFGFTYKFDLTQDSFVNYSFDVYYTTTTLGKLRNYLTDFLMTVSRGGAQIFSIDLETLEDTYDGHIMGSDYLTKGLYQISIVGRGIQTTANPDLNPRFELSGSVAPVPVPAAAWMLGAGLVALVGVRRRMPS